MRDADARTRARRQAGVTLAVLAVLAGALVALGPVADLGRFTAAGQGGQNFGQIGGTIGGVGGQFGQGGFGGQFGGQFGGGGQFGQFGGGQFGQGGQLGQAPVPQCDAAGDAPAGGALRTSVRVGSNGLEVDAAVTPRNQITIRETAPQCYEVSEDFPGVGASAGQGCAQHGPTLVSCKANIQLISVDLKAGNDSLSVSSDTPVHAKGGTGADEIHTGGGDDVLDGEAGDDVLAGSGGKDTYTGGLGDDRIAAVNGNADQIDCGLGDDTVSADLKDPDPLPRNCDNVDRAPLGSFPNLLISLGTVRARANGTVPIKVGCSPLWKPGCHGTLTLTAPGVPSFGSLRYRLRPRKIVTLAVLLSPGGRAHLAAHRRVRVRVTAGERDKQGKPKKATGHLTVRAP